MYRPEIWVTGTTESMGIMKDANSHGIDRAAQKFQSQLFSAAPAASVAEYLVICREVVCRAQVHSTAEHRWTGILDS